MESASQVLFISRENGLKKYIIACFGNKLLKQAKTTFFCKCNKQWYEIRVIFRWDAQRLLFPLLKQIKLI